MDNFVVLLRGINVSGKNKILMADLRNLLVNAGFSDVKTYIQSGNIVLNSEKSGGEVEKDIFDLVKSEFGFEVEVFAYERADFKKLIEENPFAEERVFFVFLKGKVDNFEEDQFAQFKREGEEIFMGDKIIFFYCPGSFGKSKLNNNFFEKKLGFKATTRNLRTVSKLIEMSLD